MKIFLVTIFLLAGLSVGRSQEIDPDSVKIFPIHEVVISATRTQIPLRDSPSSVNVINRQSIERSNGTTLADVLKSEGGVFIKEYGANSKFGEYTTVYNGIEETNYTTNAISNGELKITYHNVDKGILSGTFWFDAINKFGKIGNNLQSHKHCHK